jgi:hydrogenase nickel incorporation protein HypA/HybF
MHEFSMATQILESVLDFSEGRHPAQVVKVRLEIGELMCVEPEQLRFCYDSIKGSTLVAESTLEITMVPAMVKCRHCQYQGRPKYWDSALPGSVIATLQCPNCGKATEATQGHDCAIKSVQLLEGKCEDAIAGN